MDRNENCSMREIKLDKDTNVCKSCFNKNRRENNNNTSNYNQKSKVLITITIELPSDEIQLRSLRT